jgi:lysophospholipase L1-like esterase
MADSSLTETDRMMKLLQLIIVSMIAIMSSTGPHSHGVVPLRIMCLGDSITAGYTDNPDWQVPFEFGYRSGLYRRLTAAGYVVQFVGASAEPWDEAFGRPRNSPVPDLRVLDQDHHRGYGGWGTRRVSNHVRVWLAVDKPDVVLLMVGINDNGSVAARKNIMRIIETIVTSRPTAEVIVAQLTPMPRFSPGIVDLNTFINATLVPSFQARGKRVTTVDQQINLMNKAAIDPLRFSNGINHPKAAMGGSPFAFPSSGCTKGCAFCALLMSNVETVQKLS